MQRLPPSTFPSRVIYVYAIAIIGIILIASIWFMFHYMFWLIQPVASGIAESMGTNGTQYDQVDAFFQGYDNWAAILGLITLFVFTIVYSQRKGIDV